MWMLNFGCCLMYNPFLCACPDKTLGIWSCTDNKGITYYLIPVDKEGSLAFFSDFNPKDSLKVSCYCNRVC